MSDYPNYFPPFLDDFHRQKDFFKAFYLWREMMDNKIDLEQGADPFRPRLSDMSNFRDLMCLFASVLDFLMMHGWQLYRTRQKGDYADIDQTVTDMKNLQSAWLSLLAPANGLKMKPQYVEEYMQKFDKWLMYMPDQVRDAYAAFKAEQQDAAAEGGAK